MKFYEKYKSLIWIGVIVVGAVVIYRAIKKGINPLLSKNKPLVVAYRGWLGRNVGVQMMNSWSNIQELIKAKIDIIEITVRMTKDNVPVLFRDQSLDELTDGFGFLKNKTWDEIKNLKYDQYPDQKIIRLVDVLNFIKANNSDTILYISNLSDANYYSEISTMNALGILKGFEKNILVKGSSSEKPVAVYNAGIMYMTTVLTSLVGTINNNQTLAELIKRSKEATFLRLQFNEKDSFVLNGTLAKSIAEYGCQLWLDTVDRKLIVPASFRGDTEKEWGKNIGLTHAKAIVTSDPLKLKAKLG